MKLPIQQCKPTSSAARAPRPHRRSVSKSNQPNSRTIRAKTSTSDSLTELDVVLKRFRRVSHHSVSKNVKRMIEGHIEILGLRRVCSALTVAASTHKRLGVGLINRFLTVCEEMPDKLLALEDQRREAWETAQQKRLEQLEAAFPSRQSANYGCLLTVDS